MHRVSAAGWNIHRRERPTIQWRFSVHESRRDDGLRRARTRAIDPGSPRVLRVRVHAPVSDRRRAPERRRAASTTDRGRYFSRLMTGCVIFCTSGSGLLGGAGVTVGVGMTVGVGVTTGGVESVGSGTDTVGSGADTVGSGADTVGSGTDTVGTAGDTVGGGDDTTGTADDESVGSVLGDGGSAEPAIGAGPLTVVGAASESFVTPPVVGAVGDTAAGVCPAVPAVSAPISDVARDTSSETSVFAGATGRTGPVNSFDSRRA